MKFLVVEDQDAKALEITELLSELGHAEVDFSQSFIEAKRRLAASTYDWVVLDMTIPFEGTSHSGLEEDLEALGGRLLLREIKINRWPCRVVIVTQYPVFDPGGERVNFADLKKEAESLYSDFYKGIVYYRRGSSAWKSQLKEIIFS